MRVASHGGTCPRCSGRSALPVRLVTAALCTVVAPACTQRRVANPQGIREDAESAGGMRDMSEGSGAGTAGGRSAPVFISYASQDVAIADKMCAALEAAGILCWIAPRDVHAGQSYAAAIVEAINSCRMLLLLLSRSAIDSPHVLREVERASSKRRPVLSVRMDGSKLPPDLEYFLSANQWLDASGRPIEEILPALVASVRDHDGGDHPQRHPGCQRFRCPLGIGADGSSGDKQVCVALGDARADGGRGHRSRIFRD